MYVTTDVAIYILPVNFYDWILKEKLGFHILGTQNTQTK